MQMAESVQDVQKKIKRLEDEADEAMRLGDTVLYLALRQELGPLRAKEERLAGERQKTVLFEQQR
jgi:hypothetical protein